MMYCGLSWACVLVGLILFVSAYELVRFQQSAGEILSMILVGVMGSLLFGLGVFGLWECWKKRG